MTLAVADDVIARSLASWPALGVDRFRLHLGRAPGWRADLLSDLALAYAAGSGVDSAVRELTRQLGAPVRAAVTRAGYARATADDAVQEMWIVLVVGDDAGSPGLLTYQGRAPLVMWAKTIALRIASRLHAAGNTRRTAFGAEALDVAPVHDLITRSLRKELHAAVHRAFHVAAGAVSMFDRELLHAVAVEGLTIDQLGRRYEIHRATAARWLGRARGALDDSLRAELARDLSLDAVEVSSVLRAVRTSLVLPVEPLAR